MALDILIKDNILTNRGVYEQFIDKTKIEKAKPKKIKSIADEIKKEKRKRKKSNKVNLKTKVGNFMKIFKNKNSNIQS